ncbi:MAG: methyltransferase domain-containing protein [Candidatus Micrarchaeota archaeon]|nr:methyltransferase domain-containing protein [Candidatus Micrarchaeota archaeon]
MIKKDDTVLLLGKKKGFLARAGSVFHCEYGSVDLSQIVGSEPGITVETNLGEKFTVVLPSKADMFRRAKRVPQVVLPRDASVILSVVCPERDWLVVDAGSGSGFLAIFLGFYVGRVVTYEKRREFWEVARSNVELFGLDNVEVKNSDFSSADERDVDLVTLDLNSPEKFLEKVHGMLKPGGWLVVFSPYIEQASCVVRKIREMGFTEPLVIENIQREWRIEEKDGATSSRPKPYIMHTGFLTFTRRL